MSEIRRALEGARRDTERALVDRCLREIAPELIQVWLGRGGRARSKRLLAAGETLHPRWEAVLGPAVLAVWGTPITVEDAARIRRGELRR